jgi:eukaryotic-like serine/threonine-protein kinase
MADVYRAYDPGINRVLAIKVLKPEFRQSRQYTARFLREAKAAGALSHPNIVTIFDVGEESGYPYIAMELLDGETLDVVVHRRGRLPAAEVTAIGLQLADALNYAHGVGVVHRDIKPSNIMLCRDGQTIKLLDFGIAWIDEAELLAGDDLSLRTQVGQVLGTPRYMSPEQALGLEIDGRTDLFSTGVVLYELITARRAFSGANAASLALHITQRNPEPIVSLAPDCPRGLQFIIGKLVAKKPEKRFEDGARLAAALHREQSHALLTAGFGVGRALPLPARMTLLMASITALVLLVSIGTVLQRQYQAMERMTLTSGSAIASFVASNAALTAVDNASLPPEQRDWMPVQAFVMTASGDPNVQQITVVDDAGVVRAASRPGLVGQAYRPAGGEAVVSRSAGLTVSAAGAGNGAGFRFMRPILYAGRTFGRVDVTLSKAELLSVADLTRLLLAILGIVTLGSVIAVSYAAGRAVALPVRQLKAALADAAGGDLNFRISHRRKDEFGDLFDGFNRLAAAMQERLEAAEAGPKTRVDVHTAIDTGPFAPTLATSAAVVSALAAADSIDDQDRTQISSPPDIPEPRPPATAPDARSEVHGGLFERLRQLRQA